MTMDSASMVAMVPVLENRFFRNRRHGRVSVRSTQKRLQFPAGADTVRRFTTTFLQCQKTIL